MHFSLLGPLSVRDDQGPVELRGDLRRTLLAALLLHTDSPVSADRLAEVLWGRVDTAIDPARLHTQVMRLRQSLADGGERIRAVPPGYLIHVEPGELDLHVFAEESAVGRRKLADKAWAEASRHFGAALDLWRGQPLADIPALADDPRIRELEETHLQALQGRIEAELNLGRHHELLDELRTLTEEHPQHEAFHSQLILALHRAGQSDDAMAVYEAYRESLLDELGLEPSAELCELHAAVLRADPELLLPPNPNAPHQLPADTRIFTGRAAELTELVTAAGEVARTLVISALDGLGGIGKTALAIHTAHRVADRFPDGQLFIDLRGHSAGSAPMSSADALAYLLRSLGVPGSAVPESLPERSALYRGCLAESRTLILLDNAADPEQVRPLLPEEPGCLVLITSRDRLTELKHARALTLDILSEQEAVALLGKVAGPERGPEDSPAVRELAALCGHLPLALRIVAARLRHSRTLTVEDLLAELRDKDVRIGRLTDGERDLTSVFDSSFAHLPAPEQRVMRLLGLLPGPDLDVYAAANLLGTDTETAGRLLDSLLGRNLLIQQAAERYAMHDLVRAYARTLLDAASEPAQAAWDRLLAYYRHTAWTASLHHTTAIRWRPPDPAFRGARPRLEDLTAALEWLRTERANLLAAVTGPAASPEQRIDLTAAIAPLVLVDRSGAEAAALHEAAEREARLLGDTQSAADALRNLSQVLMIAGGHSIARAREVLEQAVADYRAVGNRNGEADALFRIGMALARLDDSLGSLAPAVESLRIFQEIGDRHGEAHAWQTLANGQRQLGRNEESLHSSRAALAIFDELGNRQAQAVALQKVAYAESALGEFRAAIEDSHRALAINREFGQRQAEGAVLDVLGLVHLDQGDHARADEAMSGALKAFEELDYGFGEAIMHTHLGQLRAAEGDLAAGIEHLERARALFAPLGNLYCDTEVDRERGWALHTSGDAAGRELLEQALRNYQGPVGDAPGEAQTLLYLGRIAVAEGDSARGLGHFGRALELARDTRMPVPEARALDGLSRCRESLGEHAGALDALRAAVALYERMGLAELAEARERLVALGG